MPYIHAGRCHVGAHPDDENTQLISAFSRGRGYRTAYLSITRGDGGQNESGRPLGAAFEATLGATFDASGAGAPASNHVNHIEPRGGSWARCPTV